MKALKGSLPARIVMKFIEDKGPNWAVLIAWNGLFAMFPIMLAIASVLGYLLRSGTASPDCVGGATAPTASCKLYSDLASVVKDPAAQAQVVQALEAVKHQSGWLAIAGLVGLMWGGAGLFGVMEQAFARIYDTRPRTFVKQKLMAFGMILLFALLAGFALLSSSLLPALKDVPFIPAGLARGPMALVLQVITGAASGFVLYLAIYYVVPNRRQRFRQVLPGATLAGLLLEGVSLAFPLYIQLNTRVQAYGKAFSFMLLLMFFFYLLGLITMLGVETNAVLYPIDVEQPDSPGVTVPVGKAAGGSRVGRRSQKAGVR